VLQCDRGFNRYDEIFSSVFFLGAGRLSGDGSRIRTNDVRHASSRRAGHGPSACFTNSKAVSIEAQRLQKKEEEKEKE
jgi:hypothetical protein